MYGHRLPTETFESDTCKVAKSKNKSAGQLS